MPPITIRDFGRGRNSDKNPSQLTPGEARDSLNLWHSRVDEAQARLPVDRVWATRPNGAAPVLCAFQFKAGSTEYRITKQGDKLYSFTLTPSTALTQLKTGLDSTHLPGVAVANGLAFIADWQAKNYVTDGTASGTNELQKAAPSSSAFSLASAGTATGNAAATITYWYSDVDAFSGAESPPCAAKTVSRTADQGVTVTNVSLDFTTPWTTKKLYRTIAGSDQPYLVASGLDASDFPYADTSLDTALTTVSTIHDSDGNASVEKPSAAKHACWHRGRLFLANFANSGSDTPTRVRWSRILEPTQFENTTSAAWDGTKNDGAGEVTGIVSFRGALVIFKRYSIWVMNGDENQSNFSFFQVASVGCIAPRTIRKFGNERILFLSANGVYSFDMHSAVCVSDMVEPDFATLALSTRSDFMCAGVNPAKRAYLVSVSPSGASTNTKTHVLNLDAGAWGRHELGIGVMVPSCYSDTSDEGPIRNSTDLVKLYVGDESGYLYETDSTAAVGDGVTSGTVSATVTGYAANVTTASAASFRTTGDTLKGLPMTLLRAADSTYETVAITSNTGMAITHAAFSGTNPAVGDTIYVGAFQATLSLGRVGGATTNKKRFVRMGVGFEKEATFTYNLRMGYTLDGDSVPTSTQNVDQSTGFRATREVNRRAVAVSPYFDMIGPVIAFEPIVIELDVIPLNRELPTRA